MGLFLSSKCRDTLHTNIYRTVSHEILGPIIARLISIILANYLNDINTFDFKIWLRIMRSDWGELATLTYHVYCVKKVIEDCHLICAQKDRIYNQMSKSLICCDKMNSAFAMGSLNWTLTCNFIHYSFTYVKMC